MLRFAAAIGFILSWLLAPVICAEEPVSPPPAPASDTAEAPPIVACPAGGPVGAIDLDIKPPNGQSALPVRSIVHLSEGDTITYAPILRGHEKRPGDISVVMVPLKREPNQEALIVTDPKPADKPQQWRVPETVSLAAYVYGPSGLSKKKVRNFLSQDDVLIAQLADYAEKTALTEQLLQTLEDNSSSAASTNAALTGFASQYGLGISIDRTAPPAVQAQTLFATMNPALATYDPLAPSTASRVGQTASVATAAATLFFGSPIGLAAGGTAMLLDLGRIAFPGMLFRSSFAQSIPKSTGVNLCGQRGTVPHTRIAYIWAIRIPNAPTPDLKVEKANFLPAGEKSPLPVTVADPDWKYLERARNWTLESTGKTKTTVPVLKLANQRAIELDLTKAKLPPGSYHLAGYWDWTPFTAAGDVHVLPLSDFKQAKLEPQSQDKLLAKSGKIPATLAGSDFEFTTKVELKKVGDEFATAQPARFLLPKGLREGPQDHMDVQIDTADLDPGTYQLLVSQQDNQAHPIDFKILPNPPKIANLPILANQGVAEQHYVLKGERLNDLTKLESPGATLELAAGNGEERGVTVRLMADSKPGATFDMKAYAQDRSEPLDFANGLKITGPRPIVASSKLSLPTGLGIAVNAGEFPAGYTLGAMLDVKNLARSSTLSLLCADDTSVRSTLHIGEQTDKWSLQQLSPDQLFLSYDTSSLPAGCALQALLDNGAGGQSEPYTVARILRLPKIDSVTVNGDQPPTSDPTSTAQQPASATSTPPVGLKNYVVAGSNLEMIEKVGWDQLDGVEVTGLPAAIPGQGQKQTLAVNMPDPPAPHCPLYIWLRGESMPRATTIFSAGNTPPGP